MRVALAPGPLLLSVIRRREAVQSTVLLFLTTVEDNVRERRVSVNRRVTVTRSSELLGEREALFVGVETLDSDPEPSLLSVRLELLPNTVGEREGVGGGV